MTDSAALSLIRLEIDGFGRLEEFDLEPPAHPGLVVVAPNEAGKSTLADAVLRGLFGFGNKVDESARRPWSGGPFRVRQTWVLGSDERCVITRDFDTQEVSVEWWHQPSPFREAILVSRWEGEPNPRGRSADLDRYEAQLERLLGFTSPDVFRQTVFVGPGSRRVPPIESELLRLLSGNERASFRDAARDLEAGYYALTRADLADPDRTSKQKPREIEALIDRRDEAIRARAASREAAEARRSIETDLERTREEVSRLDREIDNARSIVTEIESLRSIGRREERAAERIESVDQTIARIVSWEGEVRDRTEQLEPLVKYLRVPTDFQARLAEHRRLQEALTEVRAIAKRGSVDLPPTAATTTIGIAGVVVLIAGVVGLGAGFPIGVGIPVIAAGVLLVGLFLWTRARRRKKIADHEHRRLEARTHEGRLEAQSRAVASALGLETISDIDHERESERYDRAVRLRAELDGMQEARRALGDRAALEEERARLREETLDVLRLERRRIIERHPYLDDPDYERRLNQDLAEWEERRTKLVERELELRRELADLPNTGELDPGQLELDLDQIDEELERLMIERDAHRLAHRTLVSCLDEFLGGMIDRLEARIAPIFERLTEGRYHRTVIDPGTFQIFVDGAGRQRIASERLSRGTREQLRFAVRVAVVESMASNRVMPLVLDDPFPHLDARRLANVGEEVRRLGERHQILLLTHDERVLGWPFPTVSLETGRRSTTA